MTVATEVERTVDALLLAVLRNGLRGGGDVIVIECLGERRSAMPGGAEGDALRGIRHVGMPGVVRRDKGGDVDEIGILGHLSGTRVRRHGAILPRPGCGAQAIGSTCGAR